MCELAIHVLKSVFTRLVRQNAFASVATLRVAVFFAYPPSSDIHGDDGDLLTKNTSH